jgi:hypothetical protein
MKIFVEIFLCFRGLKPTPTCGPKKKKKIKNSPLLNYQVYYFYITDRNECVIDNGGCEQECQNTVGSRYCLCRQGYVAVGNVCFGRLTHGYCLSRQGYVAVGNVCFGRLAAVIFIDIASPFHCQKLYTAGGGGGALKLLSLLFSMAETHI